MNRFKLVDGVVGLNKPFPDNITDKEALKLSLEKWYFIRDMKKKRKYVRADGSNTCALCFIHPGCCACPIYKKTQETRCDGTPYSDLLGDRNEDGSFKTKHIKAEIKFLEGLYETDS